MPTAPSLPGRASVQGCPPLAYADYFSPSDGWHAQFHGHRRTYWLTGRLDPGSHLCGEYHDTAFPFPDYGEAEGSVDFYRRLTLNAWTPEQTTVIATIDATGSSFTGVTYGGSADRQTLTYFRTPVCNRSDYQLTSPSTWHFGPDGGVLAIAVSARFPCPWGVTRPDQVR